MRLRILVVEDYAPIRNLICTALQRPELQIVEAGDGAEAVQQAEERQPDLVLLDINLPKLNGFEVAKRIRRLVPHARLLFMSQESSPDIVRKAFRWARTVTFISQAPELICCPRSTPYSVASDSSAAVSRLPNLPMLPLHVVTRFSSVRMTQRVSRALLALSLPR